MQGVQVMEREKIMYHFFFKSRIWLQTSQNDIFPKP